MGGKWWKCRACEAHNQSSRVTCGWCRAPYQLLTRQASTKSQPTHSFDCIPPGAKGGKSKGKGKGVNPSGGKGAGGTVLFMEDARGKLLDLFFFLVVAAATGGGNVWKRLRQEKCHGSPCW